mgnify:CR=1 FL=1
MSKLNEEYFKTKQVYKENYGKQKQSFKRKIMNFLIWIVLIFLVEFLLEQCYNKIEENKNLEKINETQN